MRHPRGQFAVEAITGQRVKSRVAEMPKRDAERLVPDSDDDAAVLANRIVEVIAIALDGSAGKPDCFEDERDQWRNDCKNESLSKRESDRAGVVELRMPQRRSKPLIN